MCFYFSFFPLQLSQPTVSIEGQVSNPPSTSSTEVNSQTIPEKQPSQEVKMEVKMEVDQPEPADAQPEDTQEVRLEQLGSAIKRNSCMFIMESNKVAVTVLLPDVYL